MEPATSSTLRANDPLAQRRLAREARRRAAKRREQRLLAVLVVLAVCGAVWLGFRLYPRRVEPPDVTGLTLELATARLTAADLAVGAVAYDAASAEPTWTVVSQSATGERVDKGTPIDLVLAKGAPTAVPSLVGASADGIEALLSDAGLALGTVTKEYSDTVAKGTAVRQVPAAGTTVVASATVGITVSLGPTPAPSDAVDMVFEHKFSGSYSPKSVIATQWGLVFAQNMIYRHTISVFDAETYEEVKTIPDTVRLADFGFTQYSGSVKGGPVEAAVTPDGTHVYTSNYSMYGPGFSHPGDDVGGPSSGVDPSFVYRIDTDTLEIDQVIKVGSVPKYVAVTPDGRYVLVTNWISYTLSVIDVARAREVRQIKLGRYPRGIAVDSASTTAYVAIMGGTDIAKVDLSDFSVSWIKGVGSSPRHLVISPDDHYLYASLNGSGTLVKIDLKTDKTVGRVATGSQPRSMTIAEDGRSLYVVNYESDSVSKVRTQDMKELQEVKVGHHPIGVAYVNDTRDI
ncbi:MAG TPA: PASTA domain-containing protein, partial [Coriobacteriia bacterium]|nr:PASTA domain-containing protein [Coriobacteriia bacterium]